LYGNSSFNPETWCALWLPPLLLTLTPPLGATTPLPFLPPAFPLSFSSPSSRFLGATLFSPSSRLRYVITLTFYFDILENQWDFWPFLFFFTVLQMANFRIFSAALWKSRQGYLRIAKLMTISSIFIQIWGIKNSFGTSKRPHFAPREVKKDVECHW
jgi:hypothetical protein